MFGLSDKNIKLLQGIMAACPAVERAIIYGSRARGTMKPYSDIDIAVSGPLQPRDITKLRWDIEESSLLYKIDLVDLNALANPALKEAIMRDGQELYVRS